VSKRGTNSRGQSLVELALIAPLMLILFGAAVDFGRLFYSQITIADSAREGALWATQHPGSWNKRCDPTDPAPPDATHPNQVVCHAQDETTGGFVTVAATDVVMTPACNPGPCPVAGGPVTVTVHGTFKLIIGGVTFGLASAASGQVEQVPVPAPPVAGPQTITFGSLADQAMGTPPLTVTATASSGLAVTFSTSTTTPLVCTSGGTNGATITILAVGTCTVQADQAGNAQYQPAPPVQQSFTVRPLVCTPPVAHFTVNPTTGHAANNGGQQGTLFTFNSNTTTNMTDPACNPTWSWNFGDSRGTSSVANPSYTFTSTSKNTTRRVTLVASNLGGQSSTFLDIVVQ
jgi:Flp pilus assembly protein TadG